MENNRERRKNGEIEEETKMETDTGVHANFAHTSRNLLTHILAHKSALWQTTHLCQHSNAAAAAAIHY